MFLNILVLFTQLILSEETRGLMPQSTVECLVQRVIVFSLCNRKFQIIAASSPGIHIILTFRFGEFAWEFRSSFCTSFAVWIEAQCKNVNFPLKGLICCRNYLLRARFLQSHGEQQISTQNLETGLKEVGHSVLVSIWAGKPYNLRSTPVPLGEELTFP